MPADSKTLIEKIEALPAERIAEIEDFVDFIHFARAGTGIDPSCRGRERADFRRHLEQSRRRRLRCPLIFGDVVLVPFPFTSQRASKKRPAVVVSNRTYSTNRPDLIVMAVTSQLRPNPGLDDAWIDHWQAAGLLKPSVVKPVFATLEQRLVLRRLGALDDADQAALSKAVSEIIG